MDDAPSGGEVVIRPRAGGAPDRKRLWFALALLPLVALGIGRQFDSALGSGLWYVAGLAALAVLALLARRDFFAQTSIRVRGDHVRRTGYFGRSATCSRAAIARVVEISLVTSRLAGIPARWLLFVDARGRPLLRAYAEYYPSDQLLRLRDVLDVPWETVADVRTFARLRREVPRSFPWALAHIWLALAAIALVVIVISGVVAGIS